MTDEQKSIALGLPFWVRSFHGAAVSPALSGWMEGLSDPSSTSTTTTCIEHQAGRQTIRLSHQIKVF